MRTLSLSLATVLAAVSTAQAGTPPKHIPRDQPPPAVKPAPATPAVPVAPKKPTTPGALNPNQQFTDPYGYNRSLWGSGRFVVVVVPGAQGSNAPMNVAGGPAAPAAAGPQAPSVVVGEGGGDLSLSAPQLVRLLADPMYSDEGKTQTEVELLHGGMTSVPALVASLGDRRPFAEREIPGNKGQTDHVVVTVAEECEALLYHVITPSYRSPHEAGVKPQSPTMFVVKDWKAWWAKNKGKTLQQVHSDVRVVMDHYWQQGGVEQVIE